MLISVASMLFVLNNSEKFNNIYLQYWRLMFYKAFEILGDHGLSEDAVNEAFIRIYKNLYKLDDEIPSGRTAAFVVMVVRNVALTMVKKERRGEILPLDESVAEVYHIDEAAVSNMTAEVIMNTVDQLKEELKQVFMLYYAYDMSHKEIASALGITPNSAAVRLHRAKRKLAEILTVEKTIAKDGTEQ